MLVSLAFHSYGRFCASHPWEVVFSTLAAIFFTVSAVSFSLPQIEGGTLCWASPSVSADDFHGGFDSPQVTFDRKLNLITINFTRCAAIIYLYYQFRSLRKMGSRYILSITAFFVLLALFAFVVAVTSFLGMPVGSISNALPFLLLLMDLYKAASLAKLTLSSESKAELVENVADGMGLIGPSLLLDTVVEIMVFATGSISSYGLTSIKSICCFGSVAAVANFVVFVGFFPPFLALIAGASIARARKDDQTLGETDPKQPPRRRSQGFAYQFSRLSFSSIASDQEDERYQKSNPVVQGIKIIMAVSLVVIHLHNHVVGDSSLPSTLPSPAGLPTVPSPLLTVVLFLSDQVHLSPEQVVTLVVGVLLGIRFLFDDEDKTLFEGRASLGDDHCAMPGSQDPLKSAAPEETSSRPTFTLGDFEGIFCDAETQTETPTDIGDHSRHCGDGEVAPPLSTPPRTVEQCLEILEAPTEGPLKLTDEEILVLVNQRKIPAYNLENVVRSSVRGVKIRRMHLNQRLPADAALSDLPYAHFDYEKVQGVCCENVIGYMSLPVGVVGPLMVNGRDFHVPLATLEGALVASTNRGCKALAAAGGVTCEVLGAGMTRGPLVTFPSVTDAKTVAEWLQVPENAATMCEAFDSTTRFGKLDSIAPKVVGKMMFLRFKATTGDAMGMNMISKGTERCLQRLQQEFPQMEVMSLSGNFCVDKKASAQNWILGRGWSVSAEAVVPAQTVRETLKTSPSALVALNVGKNLIGSAVAGAVGGFNAHAANIVTALFIATGQDAAQSGTSSSCITVMEETEDNDLYISITMPSVEVGTVGGGTLLGPQSACLGLLGVKGAAKDCPGENAKRLAQVVCATVMAGELSLMAALAAGHLVGSHMRLNRSTTDLRGEGGGR